MLQDLIMTDSPSHHEEEPEASTTPNPNPAPSTPGDIPEETEYDFTISNSNNDENRSPIPPHIAARFYKPATNRRKSSAASSRRNSISSAHSHQSHLSNLSSSRAYSRSEQSNHVAQHLRRASILETRKARLADRAAHAEKVRLRAALNKAAPRGGERAAKDSEERALAAQQARERNLKSIVESCAAEVERAKGVAERARERRVIEGERLRREMEEKALEAERRREEMLNRGQLKRGRTLSMARDKPERLNKSLSPMLEVVEPISEETAARRIQNRWRIHQKWRALQDFTNFGLTIAKLRDSSFEDATAVIANQKVLLSTAKMLRICGLKEGEKGSVDEMTAVRTFLAAFLILGHPAQVLSTKEGNGGQEQVGTLPSLPSGLPMRRDQLANPQLQELVAKAGSLIVCFENVLSRLTSYNNYTPPPAQLGPLSEAYAGFYNSFIAWKARDTNAILDMMILQFVELDAIWMKVKDSSEEAVTASYRDGIRENQLKLMVRIKRLAGAVEGKRLIGKAIQESRKAKTPPKKTGGEVKPRATLEASPSPSPQVMRESHAQVEQHLEPLMTPPATPTRLPIATQPSHSGAEHLRTFGSLLPDNRTVIHELAMNKDYRIEMSDCLARRGIVNSHIFESMRREIAGGNIDPWILAMAENIRTKLQKLLKSGGAYYRLIGDMLDPEIISQELNHGSFSFERFFQGMGSIVPKLCAPFRDDEAKKLVDVDLQNGDFVTRLEALMHFIDVMQLDYANYMLQESVPQLLRHAVSYEVKAFQDGLNEGRHTLKNTERCWLAARTKVLEETARRDPEGISLTRTRPTPDKFYSHMLVDVTTSFDAEGGELPETFQLDAKRINRMKADMLRVVCTGAILLQAKNLMKRDVRSQWRTEAGRIISVLEGSKEPTQAKEGIQAALESCRNMPMATKSELRIFVSSVVDNTYEVASQEGSGLRQPVMRILMNRLRSHILGRVSATTSSEKVKATSTASEGLAGLGLPEFVAPIGKIVDEIQRMGVVDRETHGVWYEAIEKKVVEAQNAQSA